MTRSHWSALALLAALPAAASTIVPPTPGAQQAVDLRLTVDSCTFNPDTVVVSASGTTLRVIQRLNNCFSPGTPRTYDVRLGNFPVGDYRVEVYNTAPATGTPVETLSFHVASAAERDVDLPSPRPLTNYSGFWYNPDQPGWGLALVQHPDTGALFGAWFYNVSAGHAPVWSTLQDGHWGSPTGWAGGLYDTTGPTPEAADHTPTAIVRVQPASLNFDDVPNSGAMTMSVIVGGTVLMYRMKRFQP